MEIILEEIKVDTVRNKLGQYEQKWLNHISSLEDMNIQSSSLTVGLAEEEDLGYL
jgi:hypothetical protein